MNELEEGELRRLTRPRAFFGCARCPYPKQKSLGPRNRETLALFTAMHDFDLDPTRAADLLGMGLRETHLTRLRTMEKLWKKELNHG